MFCSFDCCINMCEFGLEALTWIAICFDCLIPCVTSWSLKEIHWPETFVVRTK